MTDRTVHGRTADGGEIVRYDRAGKWYVEYPAARMIPAERVSVRRAAQLATEPGAGAFDRYGGQAFRAAVRRCGGSVTR